MDNEGKNVPGRGESKGKGPEAGACLSCSKDSRKATVTKVLWTREDEVKEAMRTQIMEGLVGNL